MENELYLRVGDVVIPKGINTPNLSNLARLTYINAEEQEYHYFLICETGSSEIIIQKHIYPVLVTDFGVDLVEDLGNNTVLVQHTERPCVARIQATNRMRPWKGWNDAALPMSVREKEYLKLNIGTRRQGDIPAKKEYHQMNIAELAASLKSLREKVDKAKEEHALLVKEYDHLSIEVIPDRMIEEDIKTVQISGVGRLQARTDIRCNVLAENREALIQWLRENGHGSLATETVNSSSLKAFVKLAIEQDTDWPKDLAKVEPYTRATIVKA